MPFASPGASSSQPEIGVRLRVRDDGGSREAFARLRAQSRESFGAANGDLDGLRGHTLGFASSTHVAVQGVTGIGHAMRDAVAFAKTHLGDLANYARGVFGQMIEGAGVDDLRIGQGLAGAYHALRDYVDKNNEAVSDLKELASDTGLSVEFLSSMQAATRLAGGEVKEFDKSIKALSQSFFKSALADEASNPFLHIGINTKDQLGKLRPFTDVFRETVAALAGIKNESEQSRAAFELFGESYHDVMGVIKNDGQETFDSRLKAAYAHGTVETERSVRERDDLTTDHAGLNEDLRDIGNTVAKSFEPLTGATNIFVKAIVKHKEAVKDFVRSVGDGLVEVRSKVRELFGVREEEDVDQQEIVDGHFRKVRFKAAGDDEYQEIVDGQLVNRKYGPALSEYGKARKGVVAASDGDDEDDDDDEHGEGGTGGAAGSLTVLQRLAPLVQGVRDVVVDLSAAVRGSARLGDTVPALRDVGHAATQVAGAFWDVVSSLGDLLGRAQAGLPSLGGLFATVADAARAFRDGLAGRVEGTLSPLFHAVGQGARGVIDAVGRMAAALWQNRQVAIDFATDIVRAVSDAVGFLRVVLLGGEMAPENMFAWLGPAVPYVRWALAAIGIAFLDMVTGLHVLLLGGALPTGNVFAWLNPVVPFVRWALGAILIAFVQAFQALRSLFAGGLIPPGNLFSWLNPAIPYVRLALGLLVVAFKDAFHALRSLFAVGLIPPGNLFAWLNPVVPQARLALTVLLFVFYDAFQALRSLFAGGLIPPGNLFAWLNPVVPFVRQALSDIRDAFARTFGGGTLSNLSADTAKHTGAIGMFIANMSKLVIHAYDGIGQAISAVLPLLKWVAKAIGLKGSDGTGDAGQLILLGLTMHFLGLWDVLFKVTYLFLQSQIAMGGMANVLRLLGQIFIPIISVMASGLAMILGIPFWVSAAIVVALIVMANVAAYYWKDIQAWAHRTNNAIEGAFRGMVSAVVSAMRAVWDAVTAPFRWMFEIGQQVGRLFADMWHLVSGGGSQAWESVKTDWVGLFDLFLAPIRAIGHAFEALWEKIRGGASATFGFVRRVLHLGGGDEETKAREDVESRGEIRRPEEQGPPPPPKAADPVPVAPAAVPEVAPQGKGILQRAKDWLTQGTERVERTAPGGAETMREWFTRMSKGGASDDPRLADGPIDVPPRSDPFAAPKPRPPHARTARELWRDQWGDPDDPSNYNARRNAPAYPGETEDDRLDAAEEAAERSRRDRETSSRFDPSTAPTLDDLAGDVGDSVSTAGVRVDRGGVLQDREAAAAGAPLTLVIGGQTIDGLTYQPSALEQLRAAQRASAVGGRAPIMRGSNY